MYIAKKVRMLSINLIDTAKELLVGRDVSKSE
jgi:hypothetical protein